jgi:hypothetical protein
MEGVAPVGLHRRIAFWFPCLLLDPALPFYVRAVGFGASRNKVDLAGQGKRLGFRWSNS